MATFTNRLVKIACGSILMCVCAAAGQTAAPPQGGFRIAGTVVNTLGGHPLARARVSIQDAGNPQNLRWTITSDDGRFEFTQVPSGTYGLQGAKRGFISAAYDAHEEFSTAIVTGSGFSTENLVLRLAPSAMISGKILDESGDPVRNASVTLYRESRRMGVGRITRFRMESTDDQGAYEFSRLDPGSYFISVSATPWYALHALAAPQPGAENAPSTAGGPLDVAYPVVYYGDTNDPDDATPIPVRGGDRLQADIHLNTEPSLHLLLHLPEDGKNGFSMPMFLKPSFDGTEVIRAGGMQMVSPGVFEINGIAPGRYSVRMRGNGRGDQADGEIDITTNGQELDMSKMEPARNVKATVQLLGAGTLPPRLGIALRNSKMRIVNWEELNAKNEIEFHGVAPGKYEVLAFAQSKEFSVIRISSRDGETSGHTLNVAADSSDTVSLFLVGGSVNVEGFAKRAGKPMAGAMVVLVPKDPESHRELFRRDQSNQDGSFSLADVIPGSYTIVGIENGWDLDWASPGAIAHYSKQAKAVTVSDQTRGSMHLPDAVEVQAR